MRLECGHYRMDGTHGDDDANDDDDAARKLFPVEPLAEQERREDDAKERLKWHQSDSPSRARFVDCNKPE